MEKLLLSALILNLGVLLPLIRKSPIKDWIIVTYLMLLRMESLIKF